MSLPVEVLFDAQPRQSVAASFFGRVAADGGKLVFEFGHFDAVLVCEVFFGVECVAGSCMICHITV